MLSGRYSISGSVSVRGQQRGVVLIIVLIVLVAMTLAGVALMRSVNTTTLVAGNLAFRQAATHAGDLGTEAAVSWLTTNSAGTTLHSDIAGNAYFAAQAEPDATSGQTWDAYWTTVLDASPVSRPVSAGVISGKVWTLATDSAGNTVSYVIHRLCKSIGDPVSIGTNCAVSPSAATAAGGSKTAGSVALKYSSQIYYRITTRIDGPRNTVSYTQTIIAL